MYSEHKRKYVKKFGPIYMHTGICTSWTKTHPNCCGCKHKVPCKKYVTFLQKLITGQTPNDL